MKQLTLLIFAVLIVSISRAQIIKKDTVMLDTTMVEKIKKMPMDSTHDNMPVVPLTPKDSVMHRKAGDRNNPHIPEPPK